MSIDTTLFKAEKGILRLMHRGEAGYAVWGEGKLRLLNAPPFGDEALKEGAEIDPEKAELLPPCEPGKVVAVGLNYRSHAQEMKFDIPEVPLLFLKPSTTVIGPGADIVRPQGATRVDYEAELGVVIKKTCRKASVGEAPDFVLGYTCLNDVTERHIQGRDVQFTRAKSFDTFCPLGPVIATGLNPAGLFVRSYVNQELRQDGDTSDLIFDVPHLVSFISHVMTLLPGDVIATGTPAGVGPVKAGDVVRIEVQGVGILDNPVVDDI